MMSEVHLMTQNGGLCCTVAGVGDCPSLLPPGLLLPVVLMKAGVDGINMPACVPTQTEQAAPIELSELS